MWIPDPPSEEKDSPAIELGEARRAFLHSRGHLAAQTVQKYRSVLGQLVRSLGSGRPVQEITDADIQAFLDGGNRRAVTRRTYFTTLTPFFGWLVTQQHIERSPTEGVRLARVPVTVPKFLSPSEVDRICQAILAEAETNPHAAPGTSLWLLPVVRCNCVLGLRAGELTNLTWEQVDLERRLIHVSSRPDFTTKTGRDRVIPVAASVRGPVLR